MAAAGLCSTGIAEIPGIEEEETGEGWCPDLELEDDGDGFRANPADSLRGEGDLMMAELLDMALSCGEADGRVGEELCAGRRWRRRGCVRACVFLSA